MHKHHIIPRYFNSPCPIAQMTIDLTIQQHAEAHKDLYETYGRREDYIAWQALAGMMGKEEIILEAQRLGPLNRDREAHAEAVRQARLGTKQPQKTRNKIAQSNTGKKQSEETIAKRVMKQKGQKRPNTSAKIRGSNNGSSKLHLKPSYQKLYEMYVNDGKNFVEIGKIVGVSNVTIKKWCKEMNIPIRSHSENQRLQNQRKREQSSLSTKSNSK